MLPTITCNNQELVVLCYVVCNDIRERRDYLLLRREVDGLFELEITNGA